ncbi:MAG: hypothetical protein IJP88_11910 [Synergistaceae bacterium]|nr:hypothetical protein [Synergistaceae bacterium]
MSPAALKTAARISKYNMIGKICYSRFQFYDALLGSLSFKNRPVLIIGAADAKDYNVLPISRVTGRKYLSDTYDFPLDPKDYPLLSLNAKSYVRIHKQSVINVQDILFECGGLKTLYPDTYKNILIKLEKFNSELLANA